MSITTVLLAEVIQEQINYTIDSLVELQIKNEAGYLTAREFSLKAQELYSQLEALREQQAVW